MEPHDLGGAKLSAGREKDYNFPTALLAADLVDPRTLLERTQLLDRPDDDNEQSVSASNGAPDRPASADRRENICENRDTVWGPRTCETSPMELTAGVAVDDERLRSFCAEHGIRRLRLFGSALHDTLRADSDIDLLVEFEPDRTPGLLSIAQLELELGELLGRQVDLRTLYDLSRHFRDQVAAEARTVYDAA